ncbi:MAG: hypothetical protein AABN34_02575 [Acidobacteriota bacterium]
MVPRWKARVASILFILITTLAVALMNACRNHRQLGGEAGVEPAGEPEQYSATVVRTIEDGTTRETSITREARSGEKRRVEWTEQGQHRALIWRPDLGKAFLLDLDERAYVEMETKTGHLRESQARAADPHLPSSAQNAPGPDATDSMVQAIDHYFDDVQAPASVETRMLPAVVIDGHPCKVFEERASFQDGHTEITRRFRADDLAGLALRIECEAGQGAAIVITDRKDVRIEAAPDAFVVPPDFRRVERLLGAQASLPARHVVRERK